MIIHVVEVTVIGDYMLALTFDDGSSRTVSLQHLLNGPAFEMHRDPVYFARVSIDTVAGTVAWPNGVDIAPETLYELSSETI
ncbi:MAG: DUF2442 domain-containing protein [SAR202 cluster bacterium]|nr:DUF2442 domain-containing protein [SAR202 cluster bacterium]